MTRSFLPALLAAAVAVFTFDSPLHAQFERAPGYPEQPPAAQAYPQTGPQQQDYPQAQEPANEPDAATDQQHGVARISVVQGDVNVKRGDNGQLEAAAVNAPVMAQDHLQTSPGSRAEVQLDYGNLVRLGPNTDVGFAELQYRNYRLQLGAGTVIYRVLRDAGSQAEIDTPSIAVRPLTIGEYRISVLDDGTTQITVRSGQAEMDGPRGSETLYTGRTTLVRGNPSDPEYQTIAEIPRDYLDDWSTNRDNELMASQSYQHVSPDITGADDLDAYGSWVPSQYGQVWAPRPPVADWSPYSYGQWSWEDYYGWTWVDYAPWGWAPYHYGRWFWNTGYGWCWWPGAFRARYAWSPALVGFFGWGGSGLGWAGVGWVALAPFEVCHPWWGRNFYAGGRFGFNRYDRGRFWTRADIGRMYRNANFRGGAWTANYGAFGGPGRHFRSATRGELAGATSFRGQMPVMPGRGALRFSNRQAVPNVRLTAAENRHFFQARNNGGFARSVYRSNGQQARAPQQAQHGVPPNMRDRYAGQGSSIRGNQPRQSGGGWQRFGDAGNANTFRNGFTSEPERSGWHRFGQPQAGNPSSNAGRSEFRTTIPPRYTPSRPRYNEAQPRYNAPMPGYRAPAMMPRNDSPRFGAPSRAPQYRSPQYNAPRYEAPRYNAPRQSAPRYSAPSERGGGGGWRGSGGGGSRGGGGGGGGHQSGGHHGR